MQRRSLRSTVRNTTDGKEQNADDKGFEEEAKYESSSNDEEEETSNKNDDDGSSTSSEEVEPPPLMVLNRSRRANAGNLMQKLLTEKEIEKKEGDEVYENLWGGFLDVENDHNFEATAADFQSADEDSNSELDEQDTGEEDGGDDNEEGPDEPGDGEPRRKKKKQSSWLLTKMSETTVNENKLSETEQKARIKECLKVATRNRQSLAALKQKQLEEQQKHSKKARARLLYGPKEAWYSDKHITYMLLPEIKKWLPPKEPKRRVE